MAGRAADARSPVRYACVSHQDNARERVMGLRDDLPSKVILMIGVALHELQQSEAETDLERIRNLITNAQSTLIELHGVAEKAAEEGEKS